MCGIAGILNHEPLQAHSEQALERMSCALKYRGADDSGLWLSPRREAAFAHRRLSIIDLSSAGRQPMVSQGGRYAITFNGEIYNFQKLRADLESEGRPFLTKTDTEVILALYEKHGAECVRFLRGMFAFALWDEEAKTCLLARDPLGIKPLYVHERDGTLAFASELRALCAGGLFSPTLNPSAVQRFFETGSVPEPLTLIREAVCVEAGQTLLWKAGKLTPTSTWAVKFTHEFKDTAVERTRSALLDSVKHHFVSDVPVGIFLSGGIDSTALLALAKATGQEGISACSIAVDDEAADESPIARRTASHFQAAYHEMRLDASVARRLFGRFLEHLDQPSIDGLNTFTVSALARELGMKVVLSGLGGDELFGGYASFSKIPLMMRWRNVMRFLPGAAAVLDRGSPQHKRMADFLRSDGSVGDAYSALRGIFPKAEAAMLTNWITGSTHPECWDLSEASDRNVLDEISRLELARYMRNQLLRDSDVMSMAHGLELRVPFVDKVLVDTITSIPSEQRLRPNKGLLTAAVPEVPEWVVNQRKRGFLFPYEKWLATPDWQSAFDRALSGAPVVPHTWYQKWAIFVLKQVCQTLKIATGGQSANP